MNAVRHSEPALALAKVLFEIMERLDPGSCGGGKWEDLSSRKVDYYAFCVEEVLEQTHLVREAFLNHDMVHRHANTGEMLSPN